MREFSQLLGMAPKAVVLVGAYPLWVKAVAVVAAMVVGLVVLRMAQGEGGE